MALSGPAVMAVFLEFFTQGRCLGFLCVTFKGVPPHPPPRPLDVSLFFLILVLGVSCFRRDKGVNKSGEKDIESLLGGKCGSISEQDFCFVGFNPRQGLLAKCLGVICLG